MIIKVPNGYKVTDKRGTNMGVYCEDVAKKRDEQIKKEQKNLK